jgi:hypothetical protein
MKLYALVSLLFLMMMPTYTKGNDGFGDAPYIYYYSRALNGVVIERANGSDSRIVGKDLMPEPAEIVVGPGWSPDGRWFAWHGYRPLEFGFSIPQGAYAVSVDNEPLDMLAYFPFPVDQMLWHPTENLLLVYGWGGGQNDSSKINIVTYWLIDVDAQNLLVNMSTESHPERGPIVYWFDDRVMFYETPWLFDRFYLITMHYDGDIDVNRVSREEWETDIPGGQRDARASGLWSDDVYPRFIERLGFTEDGTEELSFTVPRNTSAAAGSYRSWNWHEGSEWLFIGYEWCYAGCSGVTSRVSIYNPTTEDYREIADCRNNHACVGWLPDQVDIDELPEGRTTSVLPDPTYFFEVEGYGSPVVIRSGQHTLDCNTNVWPPLKQLVRSIETEEVVYVLPIAEPCDETEITDQIVFTLSPNELYYAITTYREYTSVHNAETGERIATLNIRGNKLEFSDDSQTLIVTANLRGAAWDMQTLIDNQLD